uniref:helicase HerA domain-containing protein n=1 Tax=Rhodococcus sp. H36-A4 TaxID=3004353 RepID=UPI002F35872D
MAMDAEQYAALSSIQLTWAPTPDDVWRTNELHVGGMNESSLSSVMRSFDEADKRSTSKPLGVVIQGAAGSGKTHMLGQVREKVQSAGGYFFLIELLDEKVFWDSVLHGILTDIERPTPGFDSQLEKLLWDLGTDVGLGRMECRALQGERTVSPELITQFIDRLRRKYPDLKQARHTLRALVLAASADFDLQDLGDAFLRSNDALDHEQRTYWGLPNAVLTSQQVAVDISWLLSLSAPTVVAVDQIDTLIAQSRMQSDPKGVFTTEQGTQLDSIAHGLMGLRQNLVRTVAVISLLPSAWTFIADNTVESVKDRFHVAESLHQIPTREIGVEIVAKRFAARYEEAGFTPPHPTWPVAPEAFDDVNLYNPRTLLRIVDDHIQNCLRNNDITELETLNPAVTPPATPPPPPGDFAKLDARFAELLAVADLSALDADDEDDTVPSLLGAGLDAWITETGTVEHKFTRDAEPGRKPSLHGRVRRVLDDVTDDQEHWGFRAIAATHPISVQNRIQKACTAAGLTQGTDKRRLVILRSAPWPSGPKTAKTVQAFEDAGGIVVSFTESDVLALSALKALASEKDENLQAWLVARQPAHKIALFRDVLPATPVLDEAAVATTVVRPPATEPGLFTATDARSGEQAPAPAVSGPPAQPLSDTAIPLGTPTEGGPEVSVELETLRKHTAIFAGSGSGKTVLIRRLLEECALKGVSAIVLDPNNDLSRLGVEWPSDARTWTGDDEAKASDYFSNSEVVVWTPRRSAGRALSFQPLPNFAEVIDDPDEFDSAVESALSSLAPQAMAVGGTAKSRQMMAVLRQALVDFGHRSQGNLEDFIDLLENFPDGASTLKNGVKIAADLAENLKASTTTDPLFGGAGSSADPGMLLTPSTGKGARISVINMSGLTTASQKENFVNQLQMALFAWIKKNPAGDRPLGGLFVLDEAQNFAPSDRMTICLHSTLALVSQARKYGLGMVFATQAPKGLNNKIPGNCGTQFYGRLNAPVQIEAAKEVARVKGGTIPDIGKLPAGEFYAAVEESSFVRTRTRLCLSYHPKSPPTEEEVILLARG